MLIDCSTLLATAIPPVSLSAKFGEGNIIHMSLV